VIGRVFFTASGIFFPRAFFPRVFFPRGGARVRVCVCARVSRLDRPTKSSTSRDLHTNSRPVHNPGFTLSSRYLSGILRNLETERRANKKKGQCEGFVNWRFALLGSLAPYWSRAVYTGSSRKQTGLDPWQSEKIFSP